MGACGYMLFCSCACFVSGRTHKLRALAAPFLGCQQLEGPRIVRALSWQPKARNQIIWSLRGASPPTERMTLPW